MNSKKHQILLGFLLAFITTTIFAQKKIANSPLIYTLSTSEKSVFEVELKCAGLPQDTIRLKLPNWMPGYYQLMNYAQLVSNLSVNVGNKKQLVSQINDNTWQVVLKPNTPFTLNYEVKTDKKFVAKNYADSTHAYCVTVGTFMYIENKLYLPVEVRVKATNNSFKIATGLEVVPNQINTFSAPDFDTLYDCPILIGNLEELPSFDIKGIKHRFIGHKLGDFDKVQFINSLQKVIEAGVNVIGDIPYKTYTFIAIGPGNGGIEHANNSTISFDGNSLNSTNGQFRMLNFLAHEYFHHYNVKRIRPFELGPFNYDRGSRTNSLWISEGLTVYYEYLMVKRAGISSKETFLSNFNRNINSVENNPGRLHQSLAQASYNTWSDGPFGTQGKDPKKSISYYEKGPVVGLLLDFAIRQATDNKRSLDDAMREVYFNYYKKLNRGFTESEFQEMCEKVAGISLAKEFEWIYKTKPLEYFPYLSIAGLELKEEVEVKTGLRKFTLNIQEKLSAKQTEVQKSWMGE